TNAANRNSSIAALVITDLGISFSNVEFLPFIGVPAAKRTWRQWRTGPQKPNPARESDYEELQERQKGSRTGEAKGLDPAT
ncbi:MAG TPA: hypothetical protein VG345_15080, partial [Bryobacteraceae bacterium]|nr:hypothetical protein [Bryobacteraceae bacterium]